MNNKSSCPDGSSDNGVDGPMKGRVYVDYEAYDQMLDQRVKAALERALHESSSEEEVVTPDPEEMQSLRDAVHNFCSRAKAVAETHAASSAKSANADIERAIAYVNVKGTADQQKILKFLSQVEDVMVSLKPDASGPLGSWRLVAPRMVEFLRFAYVFWATDMGMPMSQKTRMRLETYRETMRLLEISIMPTRLRKSITERGWQRLEVVPTDASTPAMVRVYASQKIVDGANNEMPGRESNVLFSQESAEMQSSPAITSSIEAVEKPRDSPDSYRQRLEDRGRNCPPQTTGSEEAGRIPSRLVPGCALSRPIYRVVSEGVRTKLYSRGGKRERGGGARSKTGSS